jgi:lysophospholipase L1-like esterase
MLALALTLAMTACGDKDQPPLTVHLAGDSTMADKPDPDRNPERGWGQVLGRYFNEQVTVRNHAVNGRSTKSFIDEGKWMRLVESLGPGDYVFIQFGHNDSKAYDPSRYANAYSAYRRNLEQMVLETRERGAYPVLLSPIVRRSFNADGTLEDTHGPYPFVARSVALEHRVPFIDLQQQTEDLVSGLGPEASASLYLILPPGTCEMYPEGITDNTHLNEQGAMEVARMAAVTLRDQGLPLADYLRPDLCKPRVLVVTGGHSYDTVEFRALLEEMEHFSFDTISHPRAPGLLRSPYVLGYDVLLFYDYVPDLPLKDSSLYLNLAHHGMPLLFLHHSLCSFQQWGGFRKLAGGQYLMDGYGHDSTRLSVYTHDVDLEIRIADPGHPVTAGLEDFSIRDEAYGNIWLEEDASPLLVTEHPESSPTVAWTHRYGNSRVVSITLGHDRNAYENPAFRTLVSNALTWLASEKTGH